MNYTAFFALTLLASAVAVRLAAPLWIVMIAVVLATMGLSLSLFPRRSLLTPLVILALLSVALLLPLPLPTSWALLFRLVLIAAGWAGLSALSMKVLKT